nr:MAG TPA: hypothetical protein [Caudoviricetes sp.]
MLDFLLLFCYNAINKGGLLGSGHPSVQFRVVRKWPLLKGRLFLFR